MGWLPTSIIPREARFAHVASAFRLAEIYVPFVCRTGAHNRKKRGGRSPNRVVAIPAAAPLFSLLPGHLVVTVPRRAAGAAARAARGKDRVLKGRVGADFPPPPACWRSRHSLPRLPILRAVDGDRVDRPHRRVIPVAPFPFHQHGRIALRRRTRFR